MMEDGTGSILFSSYEAGWIGIQRQARLVPGAAEWMRRWRGVGWSLLAGDESVDARMLCGQFENDLKLPGSEDSVGVYNRRDYVASGGEGFADFAEVVLGLRAAGSSE